MLTVYGRKSSFNVQKVMWLVGELGIAHRHVELGGAFGGLDAPEFRAINPHGRVPVVVDDETTVWESHAILRYLAARYGIGTFWSEDAAARAQWERWMDWTQTSLQPDFLTGVFWGFYRTPAAQRDMRAVEEKIRCCASHFQLLDSTSPTGRSCSATASPSPTFRPARISTATSISTSRARASLMSSAGTVGSRTAPPTAPT
jgi:glutathione S-transferase